MVAPSLQTGFGIAVFTVQVVFVTLAVAAVALRVYAKYTTGRAFEMHDLAILGALIFSVGWFIDYMCPGLDIYGLSMSQVSEDLYVPFMKSYWAGNLLWICTVTLVKLSVLHFLYTVFKVPWFAILVYVIALAVCLFWLIRFLIGILVCIPVDKFWDSSIPGHCEKPMVMEIVDPCVNMFLDICVVTAPWPIIWKLQMTLKRKIQFSSIISLGLCVCAINAGRLVVTLVTRHYPRWYDYQSLVVMLASLEMYVSIVVACIPLLGPLLHRKSIRKGDAQAPIYIDERSWSRKSSSQSTFVRRVSETLQAALKNVIG